LVWVFRFEHDAQNWFMQHKRLLYLELSFCFLFLKQLDLLKKEALRAYQTAQFGMAHNVKSYSMLGDFSREMLF
jgi:hypothetical protein